MTTILLICLMWHYAENAIPWHMRLMSFLWNWISIVYVIISLSCIFISISLWGIFYVLRIVFLYHIWVHYIVKGNMCVFSWRTVLRFWCFAIDCHCSVWYCGWTTYLFFVGSILSIWNITCSVRQALCRVNFRWHLCLHARTHRYRCRHKHRHISICFATFQFCYILLLLFIWNYVYMY